MAGDGVDATMGPVELLVLEFPGSRFDGRIVPAIAELVEAGTVEILDLVFVRKDLDGSVVALELEELDPGESGGFEDVDGESGGLLSEEDLVLAADALEPGSSAALIVWENSWARKVAAAVAAAGGRLVAHDRIPAEAVNAAIAALGTSDA